MKTSAVIVAGGKGKRMGAGINKVFLQMCGKEILARTIAVFDNCEKIDEIVVVAALNDIEKVREIIKRDNIKKVSSVTKGGAERQHSVYNGLCSATGDIAVIHDGARCLVSENDIERVITDCEKYGAAALGVTVKDTLKSIDENGNIMYTVDREHTVQIQTPQVFPKEKIKKLHERAKKDNIAVTDDCSVFEKYGLNVHVTIGSYQNIKITTPDDIAVGERIIQSKNI